MVHWLLLLRDEWGKSRPAVSKRIPLEEADVLVQELQSLRGLIIQHCKYPTKGRWCLCVFNQKFLDRVYSLSPHVFLTCQYLYGKKKSHEYILEVSNVLRSRQQTADSCMTPSIKTVAWPACISVGNRPVFSFLIISVHQLDTCNFNSLRSDHLGSTQS